MDISGDKLPQECTGDALLHFFREKYGVRSKNYMIYERTERIPDHLLDRYIALLNAYDTQFLEILRKENGCTVIRYVDEEAKRGESFYEKYRDLFRDGDFPTRVKNTVWGGLWENEASIPYVRNETAFYSYFCFEKKYAEVVSKILPEEYRFCPDILNVEAAPDVCYVVKKSDAREASRYAGVDRSQPGLWARLMQRYCIPVIQIDDIRGKLAVQHEPKDFLEPSRHRQSFRLDVGHIARSSWEANVARVLQKLGISYEYERETFELDDELFYVPDFFLEGGKIVEVKGFWDDESRKKVAALEKQHPEYTVFPLDSDMYESLRLKYADQVSEWEENSPVRRSEYKVSIVGMKFCASKETLQSLSVGDALVLEREPENKFDKNAILAKTTDGKPIGHFSADWSAIFAPKIDIGMTYSATISDIQRSVIHANVKRVNFDTKILYDFFA